MAKNGFGRAGKADKALPALAAEKRCPHGKNAGEETDETEM